MATASLTCNHNLPLEDVVSLAIRGARENGIKLKRQGNNLHGERLPFRMDAVIKEASFTITIEGPSLPFGFNPNAIIGKIKAWLSDKKGITT
jgi:hypothetical protein